MTDITPLALKCHLADVERRAARAPRLPRRVVPGADRLRRLAAAFALRARAVPPAGV